MTDGQFLVNGEEMEISPDASVEIVALAKEKSNALVYGGYA